MRFLFCGDSNCPEWFLAESALLTKIVIHWLMFLGISEDEVSDLIYFIKYCRWNRHIS